MLGCASRSISVQPINIHVSKHQPKHHPTVLLLRALVRTTSLSRALECNIKVICTVGVPWRQQSQNLRVIIFVSFSIYPTSLAYHSETSPDFGVSTRTTLSQLSRQSGSRASLICSYILASFSPSASSIQSAYLSHRIDR